MDSNRQLKLNVEQLMEIKGMNVAQIVKKAKSGGHSVHATTISNILQEESKFGAAKLDAIAYAFDLEPCYMLWPNGFDSDGQPVGIGSQISLQTVSWAVKKVSLTLSYIGNDDLEFKSQSISDLIKIASEKGFDAADLEWQKKLAEYNR